MVLSAGCYDLEGGLIFNEAEEAEDESYISLTAEPADNWSFMDWEGNGATETTTIYVTEDKTVKAIFGTFNVYDIIYERNVFDHWIFEGFAENLLGQEISYVEIHIYLYDKDGIRVGSGWTNETNIPPGEIFRWKIYTDTDSDFPITRLK